MGKVWVGFGLNFSQGKQPRGWPSGLANQPSGRSASMKRPNYTSRPNGWKGEGFTEAENMSHPKGSTRGPNGLGVSVILWIGILVFLY